MATSFCKACRKAIKITPGHLARGNGQYCSKPCYATARRTRPERACLQCGTSFKAQPTRLGWQKYCSTTCSGKARWNREERQCQNCQKSYWFMPSQLSAYKGAGKYCSRACHYQAKTLPPDAPPVDRYGRTTTRKHGIDWKNTIRAKYDSICQRCGIYEQHIHTHHIATRASRPDLRYDTNNGITLCGSCHSWVHHHPAESYEKGWLSNEKYELAA